MPDEFTVPPAGAAVAPQQEEPEKQDEIPAIGMEVKTPLNEDLLLEEAANITDAMRDAYLVHTMTDEPYEETYEVAKGALKITFKSKSLQDYHASVDWVNSKLTPETTNQQFYSYEALADLACFLKKVTAIHPTEGKEGTIDYTAYPFASRVEHLLKFSGSKFILFTELLSRFAARMEVMRRELLESGLLQAAIVT